MTYREPHKPKEREMRLSLTRGEVNEIVLKHLRESGKLPKDAKLKSQSMMVIPDEHGGGYLGDEKDASKQKWEHHIAYLVSWTETE